MTGTSSIFFSMSKPKVKNRIQLLDAIRGFCIILMVAYHCGYDLVLFGLIPHWVLYNALLNFLQPFFAGVFIVIAGISSKFSRGNIKRGLLVLAAACLVTAVTWLMGSTVLFGILHFLGSAMVLYGLIGRWTDKLPDTAAPFLFAALFILTKLLLGRTYDIEHLWWLGIIPPGGVSSSDFFPIFPWLFAFLFGTWTGRMVFERRLPDWFYTARVPVLPWIGRHSLIIYLLHQPVLYSVVWLIAYILL